MTLSIRPVRLKKSVYFRVPSDIADLIELEDNSQVVLTLEEKDDRHLLIYSVVKDKVLDSSSEHYTIDRATVPPLMHPNHLMPKSGG